jgi:hypothetical protein
MITKGGAKIKGLAEKTTNKEIKHIRFYKLFTGFYGFPNEHLSVSGNIR